MVWQFLNFSGIGKYSERSSVPGKYTHGLYFWEFMIPLKPMYELLPWKEIESVCTTEEDWLRRSTLRTFVTLHYFFRIYLGGPKMPASLCYAEDVKVNKGVWLWLSRLPSQEAAHALWPLLWWRQALHVLWCGWGCQKFPREDEMQGRIRICHGEVGKEEAEESAQSPEQ